MLGNTTNARIIFEEEFTRQVRRFGWRLFTFGIPIILLIIAFIVPVILDAFSDDDEDTGVGELIGYVDNAGITDSLDPLPGLIRISDLDLGTQSLADGNIEGLFVIPADYVDTGEVDWYRITGGLASEDGTGDVFRDVLEPRLLTNRSIPCLWHASFNLPATHCLRSMKRADPKHQARCKTKLPGLPRRSYSQCCW